MTKRFDWHSAAICCLVLLAAGALMAQEVETRVIVKGGAWLGVYLADADEESGWEEKDGAVVKDVVKDGPADKAGVREGDIIVKLQDRTVRDANDVTRDVRKMKPGDEVQILVLRDGKKVNLKANLAERKASSEPAGPIDAYKRSARAEALQGYFGLSKSRLGVQVQEMDADLAGYFQVKEGGGVLVTEVEKESPAAAAGLKSGDVITAVNGKPVAEATDLVRAMDKSKSSEQEITYLRQGRTEKVMVKTARPESRVMQFRFNGDDWPFSKETMDELRKDLEQLKEEMKELKIKLDIEIKQE